MDRREAIKTGVMVLAGTSVTVGAKPPAARETKIGPDVKCLIVKRRDKWRIVDQMIEEHGDGETWLKLKKTGELGLETAI